MALFPWDSLLISATPATDGQLSISVILISYRKEESNPFLQVNVGGEMGGTIQVVLTQKHIWFSSSLCFRRLWSETTTGSGRQMSFWGASSSGAFIRDVGAKGKTSHGVFIPFAVDLLNDCGGALWITPRSWHVCLTNECFQALGKRRGTQSC